MYEEVNTSRKQKKFEKTWEYFCSKYGWLNDPYAVDGNRYNLLLNKSSFFRINKVVGTIEFIPYDPNNPNSTVESHIPFSKYTDIKTNQDLVWEIDKLCIHQDYQRQGYLQTLLLIIYRHAKEYNSKYYLAIIEKKFFRMLRIMFPSIVEQRGEAVSGTDPNKALIPTVIHMEKLLKSKKLVKKITQ